MRRAWLIAALLLAAFPAADANTSLAAARRALLGGSPGPGPCDVAQAAGTPCVAAHGVTRRLLRSYIGPLFQITRGSDNTTLNVGSLPSGRVNQSAINSFCAATTCSYSLIYDQMHTPASGNNLPQATAANQAPVTYTTFANGATLPMVATLPGQYYRNRDATVGVPSGNSSISEYMVINTFAYSPCCGTYGNMESTTTDNGAGHMFALGFGTGAPEAGTGNGPWPAIDYENGFYTYDTTPTSVLLSEIEKYNSSMDLWAIKSDPGLTGSFSLLNSSTPPAAAAFEGGISLGEGGDATPAPTAFFEGIIIAAPTTDATDNAIATNAAAFYKGTPSQPAQTPVLEANQCGAGSTTCTFNFLTNVPAGSLIVVLTYDQSASPQSDGISDTQGNTYTLITQQCPGLANGNAGCLGPTGAGTYSMFYSYNVKALTMDDTMSMTNATATRVEMDAVFVTGMPTSDPLDHATVATAFGTTGTDTIISGTPAQSGELFVAISSSGTIQLGWVTPFTFKFIDGWGNAGTIRNPAALPTTWSVGPDTNWAAMIAGFKPQ